MLEGPDGPLRSGHLVCGGIYDQSTGLIYQHGRYFDPTLGIWLALAPLVMIQSLRGRKKKRVRPWFGLVLMVVFVSVILVACGGANGDKPDLEKICATMEYPSEPTVAAQTVLNSTVGLFVQKFPDLRGK